MKIRLFPVSDITNTYTYVSKSSEQSCNLNSNIWRRMCSVCTCARVHECRGVLTVFFRLPSFVPFFVRFVNGNNEEAEYAFYSITSNGPSKYMGIQTLFRFFSVFCACCVTSFTMKCEADVGAKIAIELSMPQCIEWCCYIYNKLLIATETEREEEKNRAGEQEAKIERNRMRAERSENLGSIWRIPFIQHSLIGPKRSLPLLHFAPIFKLSLWQFHCNRSDWDMKQAKWRCANESKSFSTEWIHLSNAMLQTKLTLKNSGRSYGHSSTHIASRQLLSCCTDWRNAFGRKENFLIHFLREVFIDNITGVCHFSSVSHSLSSANRKMRLERRTCLCVCWCVWEKRNTTRAIFTNEIHYSRFRLDASLFRFERTNRKYCTAWMYNVHGQRHGHRADDEPVRFSYLLIAFQIVS